MKTILFALIGIFWFCGMFISCNTTGTPISDYASDTIDVFASLLPERPVKCSKNKYGDVDGHNLNYTANTEQNRVYVDFKITLLELHPNITANLISFAHYNMLEQGFIDDSDTIPPFTFSELYSAEKQYACFNNALDWLTNCFYQTVPSIMEYNGGYNIGIKIQPVFLNDRFVTYHKYAYYYTGGAHGNYTSFLQTYDRESGKTINITDIIKPEAMSKVRRLVAEHMASKYAIGTNVRTVEQYIDSLNGWLYNIHSFNGAINNTLITLENYPINDPGIHPAGLVFTYEKYDLTPGVYGCPYILLTFDELNGCLLQPFDSYRIASNLIGNNDSTMMLMNCWYSESEVDSVRASWGMSDCGNPFPIDIFDQYLYRNRKFHRNYDISEFSGTWIGYGHRWDSREILTINSDGSYTSKSEEALNYDYDNQLMNYQYYSTTRGFYTYDKSHNKLSFLNTNRNSTVTLDEAAKYEHPENCEIIVHAIKGDTMEIADHVGDIHYYFRPNVKIESYLNP